MLHVIYVGFAFLGAILHAIYTGPYLGRYALHAIYGASGAPGAMLHIIYVGFALLGPILRRLRGTLDLRGGGWIFEVLLPCPEVAPEASFDCVSGRF